MKRLGMRNDVNIIRVRRPAFVQTPESSVELMLKRKVQLKHGDRSAADCAILYSHGLEQKSVVFFVFLMAAIFGEPGSLGLGCYGNYTLYTTPCMLRSLYSTDLQAAKG